MALVNIFMNLKTEIPSLKNSLGCVIRRTMCIAPGCADSRRKGLVLGVYTKVGQNVGPGVLTKSAEAFDQKVEGKLTRVLKLLPPAPKAGQCRILYDLHPNFAAVALVGIGNECMGYDSFEQIDEGKEAIRVAAATGVRALRDLPLKKICVESFGHAESAAEGAALGVWIYQEKKQSNMRKNIPGVELYEDCDFTGWYIGLQKASAQNFTRQLTDTAGNAMSPSAFAQNAVEILCKAGINVEVKVRAWAESQKMNAFLAAAKGSCEPPIFLELSYYGTSRSERPVVLIGKGVTYNCGGLCLKNPREQSYMRADMSGAACVIATSIAIANFQLPINVRGLIPLCENMPGCSAVKPGDIVRAMNGKTIKIESTDCAGRLLLADALVYAQSFWPRFIMDIGTMSTDTLDVLGPAGTAVFTNSEALWEYLLAASMHTGDRIWRFPLWNHFTSLLTHDDTCDIKTHPARARKGVGGSCTIAAFLNEFLPCGDWAHLDIQSVIISTGHETPYLREGMSGRPTRTLVEFFSQLVCHKG